MSKAKGKKEPKTTVKSVGIPIKWNIPDNIITRFASNMTVQVLENEFKVSFFEMYPEIRIGENLPLPKEVNANCVASVIISANKLPSFITALQQQYDLYKAQKAKNIDDKS